MDECIRHRVSEHVWKTGHALVQGFRALADSEGVRQHVRIIGFDCNPQIVCTHEDGSYWPALHTSFHEEVIAHGVLIPWTSICSVHGDKELQRCFEALGEGMRKVRRVLAAGEPLERSFSGSAIKPVFRKYNRCLQGRCGREHADAPRLACCQER
jgi:glutamate-1-semialdehyde 2,1-aminomutase